MENLLVRLFDSMAAAEAAQRALFAAGYERDAVTLHATTDEAGPEQGNFTVGNGDRYTEKDAGKGGSASSQAGRNEAGSYRRNYADPRWNSVCVMTVETKEGDAGAAARILLEHGGIDSEQRAGQAKVEASQRPR